MFNPSSVYVVTIFRIWLLNNLYVTSNAMQLSWNISLIFVNVLGKYVHSVY